ncbi:unnamed protein product, partial [marine sediment metagenome]
IPTLKMLRIDVDFLMQDRDVLQSKREIESTLDSLGKKLVILIDDLDRLEPKEMVYTLKLVKLCADFKRCVYVVACDKSVVEKGLCKQGLDESFLEKIIQLEIPVPKIEQQILDEFFAERLNAVIRSVTGEDADHSLWDKLRPLYHGAISPLMKTLRDTKRYLNALKIRFPQVKDEVNCFDFLILELIRINYPTIYEDIYQNKQYYYYCNWSAESYVLALIARDIDKERSEHLENLLKPQGGKEGIPAKLLAAIFP